MRTLFAALAVPVAALALPAVIAAVPVPASAQAAAKPAAPSLTLPGLAKPPAAGAPAGAAAPSAAGANAGAAAAAQQQLPPAQWTKQCAADPDTKKNVCAVREVVTDDTGQQLLASATVQTTQDNPKMLFIITVPPAMLLQPGVQVAIDTNMPMALKYTVCEPNACFADMDFTADNLKAIRAGKQLTIAAINQAGQQVSMPISLAGFGKAYDGPATNPDSATGTPALDALGATLQQKADQARQTLTNQQKP